MGAVRGCNIPEDLLYSVDNNVWVRQEGDGSVTVGPNAVQGWKREGYGRLNFSLRDTAEMLAFPGFWRVTGKGAVG